MGIGDLWESAEPQKNEPSVEVESREMSSDRSHRWCECGRRRNRVGGADEYRGADGFEVARSSYQGRSMRHYCYWLRVSVEVVRAVSIYVQSCRGMSLSEVRFTPEGFEVRTPSIVTFSLL